MSEFRRLIDVHAHVFPDKIARRAADNVANYYDLVMEADGTVAGLLAGAEGLDARFVISSAALKAEHVATGNDFLLDAAAAEPRFIPLASVHPDMGAAAAVDELERVKARGARGVKLHPDFQRFIVDREDMFPVYEACAALGLPVLFHVGDQNSDASSPARVRHIAERVPALKVIAAHMCGYSVWDEAERELIGMSVYTDTSDALIGLPPERVYALIEKHGVTRVMFGSDYPLRTTRSAYDALMKLPFTDAEREQILLKTAADLFGV